MWIGNVCLDEQAVHLRVDVFHGHLESVEATGLRHLNLLAETFDEILVHNAIGCGEKGQHMADKFTFVILERMPMVQITRQVHFGYTPKGCLRLCSSEKIQNFLRMHKTKYFHLAWNGRMDKQILQRIEMISVKWRWLIFYQFLCVLKYTNLFVHCPDVFVLNGENDKATWIFA